LFLPLLTMGTILALVNLLDMLCEKTSPWSRDVARLATLALAASTGRHWPTVPASATFSLFFFSNSSWLDGLLRPLPVRARVLAGTLGLSDWRKIGRGAGGPLAFAWF
jgi:hypothetical protein